MCDRNFSAGRSGPAERLHRAFFNPSRQEGDESARVAAVRQTYAHWHPRAPCVPEYDRYYCAEGTGSGRRIMGSFLEKLRCGKCDTVSKTFFFPTVYFSSLSLCIRVCMWRVSTGVCSCGEQIRDGFRLWLLLFFLRVLCTFRDETRRSFRVENLILIFLFSYYYVFNAETRLRVSCSAGRRVGRRQLARLTRSIASVCMEVLGDFRARMHVILGKKKIFCVLLKSCFT